MKEGFIYIVTNKLNTVLYTGVTSDLKTRVYQHKIKFYPKSFTSRYNCSKLVYYEIFDGIEPAIEREKYIKGKSRKFKLELIKSINPSWADLWEEVYNW